MKRWKECNRGCFVYLWNKWLSFGSTLCIWSWCGPDKGQEGSSTLNREKISICWIASNLGIERGAQMRYTKEREVVLGILESICEIERIAYEYLQIDFRKREKQRLRRYKWKGCRNELSALKSEYMGWNMSQLSNLRLRWTCELPWAHCIGKFDFMVWLIIRPNERNVKWAVKGIQGQPYVMGMIANGMCMIKGVII